MTDLAKLSPAAPRLGEGPLWRAQTKTILWVDILNGEIHETDLNGTDRVLLSADEPVSAVFLDHSDQIVYASRHEVRSLDGRCIASLPLGPVRFNDGKPDPAGRLVLGTMGFPDVVEGVATLWSYDGSSWRDLIGGGVTISNGLCWDTDGTSLFYVDTPTRRIDVFDYDVESGHAHNRRPWADLSGIVGVPDGMCRDRDGGIWVAMWGGSRVVRVVDGTVVDHIDIPVPNVTCPAFVGDELDLLVITTAQADDGSTTGGLFLTEPGVRGTPSHRLGDWANRPE